MSVPDPTPCACGSGLRTARCCQLDRAALAAPAAMEHLRPLVERAFRAHEAGDIAEALIRRSVVLDPNNVWATQELALLLFDKGDLVEAEIHARNAVRIAPRDAQSHNLMGMIMTEANRPQTGEYHYRKVIELLDRPNPIVLANLAW